MSPVRMSRIESTMRLALAYNEALNHHDIAGMMALLSDDCVWESSFPAPAGAMYQGKEALAAFWQAFFNRSPAALFEVEEIFGLGKRCVLRLRYEGEDATGEKEQRRGISVFRMNDKVIVEELAYVKG